ncbi:hypothetical protein VKT23_020210 [Stygiomarasmius scandens]|uniref:Zinc finger PHD-type domain-containing protein n=1 Tax=Marasmiellus scandens TaxID=2682957 RepID=A0ABR1IM97_9AGAR
MTMERLSLSHGGPTEANARTNTVLSATHLSRNSGEVNSDSALMNRKAQPSLQDMNVQMVSMLSKSLLVKIPHYSSPKFPSYPTLVLPSLPDLPTFPSRQGHDGKVLGPTELDDTPQLRMVYGRDNGEDDSPVECDKVPYHLGCLKPPLKSLPDGEWFCPRCAKEPGKALTAPGTPRTGASRKWRGDDMEVDGREDGDDRDDDGEDEDMDEDDGGRKRKAASKSARGEKALGVVSKGSREEDTLDSSKSNQTFSDPGKSPVRLAFDARNSLGSVKEVVALGGVLDAGVDEERVCFGVNVLHHDLETVESTSLGGVDFVGEMFDKIFIDDTVRGGKESENMEDEVTFIVVHAVVPVVEVLGEIHLLAFEKLRPFCIFVKSKRGVRDNEV